MSFVSIAVLFSCMRCMSAPICGSAVSMLKRSIA